MSNEQHIKEQSEIAFGYHLRQSRQGVCWGPISVQKVSGMGVLEVAIALSLTLILALWLQNIIGEMATVSLGHAKVSESQQHELRLHQLLYRYFSEAGYTGCSQIKPDQFPVAIHTRGNLEPHFTIWATSINKSESKSHSVSSFQVQTPAWKLIPKQSFPTGLSEIKTGASVMLTNCQHTHTPSTFKWNGILDLSQRLASANTNHYLYILQRTLLTVRLSDGIPTLYIDYENAPATPLIKGVTNLQVRLQTADATSVPLLYWSAQLIPDTDKNAIANPITETSGAVRLRNYATYSVQRWK